MQRKGRTTSQMGAERRIAPRKQKERVRLEEQQETLRRDKEEDKDIGTC